MTMQLRSIILYNRAGATRELSFKRGAVNIITGRSLTGKSAIVEIIDYCLGRSSFLIPEGVIRDTVAWYSVVFSFGDGTEVLIAKPTPKENAVSQSQAYYEVGRSLVAPPLAKLIANTNDDGVVAELSKRLGIVPNLHRPAVGQTRDEVEATVRHTVYYLFQTQGLIASKELLFHRQLEPFIAQAIKDTLPYFLGVANSDRVRLEHELRLARRRLKVATRDLEESQFIASDQLRRGQSLVMEAQQAGVLKSDLSPESSTDVMQVLGSALTWVPSAAPVVAEDRLTELRKRVDDDRDALKSLQKQIESAEVFQRDAQAYASEANEHLMRLQSIGVINENQNGHKCPVCSSDLPAEVPTVSALNDSLRRLGSDLRQVEGERPRLREYIDGLKSQQEDVRQRLSRSSFNLEAALSEQEAAEAFRNANSRAARVVGRISLYVETVRFVNDEGMQNAVKDAQADVARLESQISDDADQDILVSILNRIGIQMTEWGGPLQLEYPGPYRLDLNNLTVVVDRPGRPIPMQRLGGGKNWLGCHLLALLALHKHFATATCPVPGILVLDQPTQVYFPSMQKYTALTGTTAETIESDADLEAVKRVFDLLFTACVESQSGLQIVVLEHANLPEERYQKAMVEAPWSGKGEHALVPENWK